MKKTIAWVLTATTLFVLLVAPVGAVGLTMTDVSEDLRDPIEVLRLLNVVSGFPDGTFRPEQTLTRAQFCKMAVLLLGVADQADLYRHYTIFPDVRSNHWAVGYINLAVKSLKLLQGLPDGTFRPEEKVTFAQAVTLLVRVLGYTDSDVGLLWPSGYLKKGASIGLTEGMTVLAGNGMTRKDGLKIFYNLLRTRTKSGAAFLSTLGSLREQAIVLDVHAKAADGSSGAVLLAGESTGIKSRQPLPEGFEGKRGTLLLDEAGWIKTFLPSTVTLKHFSLAQSVYPTLKAESGESYTLKSDTPVYMRGEMKPFVQVSYDLVPGTPVELVFTASGAVDYLIVRESELPATALVLTSIPTEAAIRSMLGAPADARILKNGAESTSSDLRKYDVVTYSAETNICSVSDFKLTGAYEFVYPNTAVPSRITVLGNEFVVMSQAIEGLAKFSLGQAMTLLFTADKRVAAVVPNAELNVQAVGYYTGTTVELFNGPTLSVPAERVKNISAGTLVRVYSFTPNQWQVTEIQDNLPTASLNVTTGMLGDKKITASAAYFEKVGPYGALARIERSDLVQTTLPASRVYHAELDTAGRVIAVVLDDVTRDLYDYGKLLLKMEEEWFSFGDSLTKVEVWYAFVNNSSGDSTKFKTVDHSMPTNVWSGVTGDKFGRTARIVELARHSGITRSSFSENRALWIGGVLTPIADDVQVYLNQTGTYMNRTKYTTLEAFMADVRAFGSSFEAYTEKAPAEGGRVRMIVVNS